MVKNSFFMAFLPLFLVGLLLPMTALGDFDLCNNNTICGKGTCKSKPDYIPHHYICECDSGWRRTRLSDAKEQYLQFLPCIVPNCSINYSCMPAPPPLPPVPTNPDNPSFYNPCNWIYCGEGECIKPSEEMHTCRCRAGAYNLLNMSHFPCYSDCAIGSDCSKLGIKVSTESTPSESSSSSSGARSGTIAASASDNKGSSVFSSGKFNWMVVLVVSVGGIFWK